ncbi:Ionotropic receptor 199, partial [Hyalella azteca]
FTKLLMGGVMENLRFRWWGQLTSCTLHSPYQELDF